MIERIRVFWVDEEAETALTEIKSRLDNSMNFKPDFTSTLDSAREKINDYIQYDVIVIDVRIPKNNADIIANRQKRNSNFDRNGVELVEMMFKLQITHKMLIFTNESLAGLKKAMPNYTISESTFWQKTYDITADDFLNKLIEIYNNNKLR